uniref:Ribosome modulation factor n=2 Tax=Vibrionaceae TaxID=641 RepID=A0A0H3ZRX6_VIBSP|nr:hypothetical protein [Vibrio splendidus]AKN40564.1 hypothetical protein [Enterovibrio norvegicus]
MLGTQYNKIMKQGATAYKNGVPYSKNPHSDDESKAAWVEGWQAASFQERQCSNKTIQ